MITDEERRRVAARLRELGKLVYSPDNTYELMAYALGVDDFDGTDEMFARIADLIEPDPRAEEIAAKAYRAAADYIDWNIPDSEERVRRLRERAEELEAMARERGPYDYDTTKTAADTTKCDREALLALADEMERAAPDYSLWEVCEGTERNITDEVADFARRIREACEGQKTPDASTDADRGTRVDREVLLALAREMKFKAKESEAYFAGVYPGEVIEYADRIREALGVSDD